MSTVTQPLTGEQVLAMGDIGRWELIYGKVVKMSPSGFMPARIAAQIALLLGEWNRRSQLGVVLGAEGGFRLSRNPDLLRAPDAAWVDAKRVGPELPSGFFEGAPDLAVEVVSPGDSWSELESKVEMWLAYGCRSCWVVNPQTRQISVYRGDGSVLKLKETQELTDDVLPGFQVSVLEIFGR